MGRNGTSDSSHAGHFQNFRTVRQIAYNYHDRKSNVTLRVCPQGNETREIGVTQKARSMKQSKQRRVFPMIPSLQADG